MDSAGSSSILNSYGVLPDKFENIVQARNEVPTVDRQQSIALPVCVVRSFTLPELDSSPLSSILFFENCEPYTEEQFLYLCSCIDEVHRSLIELSTQDSPEAREAYARLLNDHHSLKRRYLAMMEKFHSRLVAKSAEEMLIAREFFTQLSSAY